MVKLVKKVKVAPTAFSHLHLTGIFLPLFIAIFYFPQATYIPTVAARLLILSVVPVIVVSAFILSNQWSKIIFPRNLAFAFLAFIGYLLFRAAVSSALWHGFVGTSDRNLGLLTYIVFFLFAWMGFQIAEGTNPRTLVNLITLLGVGQASIANYQYFVEDKSVGIIGTFYNSNPVSFLLGIIAASVFAYLFYEKKRRSAGYFALVLSLFWIFIGLCVCGSQQGLLIFALIVAILTITEFVRVLQMHFEKILFPTFAMALVTFVIASFLLPIKNNSQIASNAFLERLEIYKSAMKLAIENPFFGVGIESFQEKYGQVTLTTLMQLVDNAHSVPLHILSTLGIFGLATWLTIIFLVFKNTKSGFYEAKAEFKFFQIGFFSYLLIGIVGIEHPVIGAISWLMAGVLIKLSISQDVDKKVNKPILGPIRSEKRFVLACSVTLVAISLYLLPQQLVLGKAITDFSENNITRSEFDILIANNLKRIWSPSLLLFSGEAYIAIDQQVNALIVANVMLRRYPNDQRTSSLFFAIANKWKDQKAQGIAEEIRDRIFK